MNFEDVVSSSEFSNRHSAVKQSNRSAGITATILCHAPAALCLGEIAIQASHPPGFSSRAYADGVVRHDLPLPVLGLAGDRIAFGDVVHGASPGVPLDEASSSHA